MGDDPKTALNTFCQRYCKRAISKTDIEYHTQRLGTVMQSTVKLNCLDGVEFAGEVASNQKDAEKNAAKQAMQNYAAEYAGLAPAGKNSKKKAADPFAGLGGPALGLGGPPALAHTPDPMSNAKVALNQGLMRIMKKTLTKEDVVFNTVSTALGFQSTVSVPFLPAEWGGFAWAGEVATKKKEAEENAAQQAVAALRADPAMCQAMDTPPVKPNKGFGKGKSKGFGKSFGKGYGGGGMGGCGGGNLFSPY